MNISGASGVSGSFYDTHVSSATRASASVSARGTPPDAAAAPSPATPSDSRAQTSSAVREPGATAKPAEMSKADLAQLRQLQQRDRVVRQHEMAHLAASGGLAVSGASYSFQHGPDGVAYAVGGEVNINTSPGRTPQETIARADTIIAAALAPADPSAQDRAVAAQAQQMRQQALTAEMRQRSEEVAQVLAAAISGDVKTRPHPGIEKYLEIAGTSSSSTSGGTPRIDTSA